MLLVLSMGASEVVPRASMSDIAPKLVHALREYNPVFVPCVFLIMQQGPVFWKGSFNLLSKTSNAQASNPVAYERLRYRVLRWRRSRRLRATRRIAVIGLLAILVFAPMYFKDTSELWIFNLYTLIAPFTYLLFHILKRHVCVLQHSEQNGEDRVQRGDSDEHRTFSQIVTAAMLASCMVVSFIALWPSPVQYIAISAVFYSAAYYVDSEMDCSIASPRKREMKQVLLVPTAIAFPICLGSALYFLLGYSPSRPLRILPNSYPSNVDWLALVISLVILLTPLQMVRMLFIFGRRHSSSSFEGNFLRFDGSAWVKEVDPELDAPTESYSLLACLVLIASFFATAYWESRGFVVCTFENVIPTTMLFAIPAMSVSAVVLAAARGELKDLWCYVEDPETEESPRYLYFYRDTEDLNASEG